MNKTFLLASVVASTLALNACDSGKKAGPKDSRQETAARLDTPILPVKKGDLWRYDVRLEIPAGVTAPDAQEVNRTYQLTRTYLGKLSPATGLPEVDCFEVVATNTPPEREFVEISDDRILMRGSMIMHPETTKPMWLERPIPFVIAGMKAGTELPSFEGGGGGFSRRIQVIARESVTVPAGTFPSIRILMTGMDGDFELRRTTWFSPGIGIVREEKTRYRKDTLLFHETQQLAEISPKRP